MLEGITTEPLYRQASEVTRTEWAKTASAFASGFFLAKTTPAS